MYGVPPLGMCQIVSKSLSVAVIVEQNSSNRPIADFSFFHFLLIYLVLFLVRLLSGPWWPNHVDVLDKILDSTEAIKIAVHCLFCTVSLPTLDTARANVLCGTGHLSLLDNIQLLRFPFLFFRE